MKFLGSAYNKHVREFLIYIRINDWLHILGLAVLGIIFYSSSSLFTLKAILGLIVSMLYLAHGFSLNNYFDTAIDQRINKRYLPPTGASCKRFLLFSYSLFLINCFLAWWISIKLAALIILGSILALIYSAPPLRLKKSTCLNIILNSAGFAIIFLIGFLSVSQTVSWAALIMSVLFALIFIPLQIVHQISHSEADKVENILTIFNRYGLKPTIYLLYLSLAVLACWSLLIGILYHNYIGIFYLTCLFCFLFLVSLRRIKNNKKTCPLAASELRIFIRKICILYGITLIFILYFVN
jgi:4-hydroxybenzoate polyprenyltransferase